jgi:3-oxoadipate enol-lactonase
LNSQLKLTSRSKVCSPLQDTAKGTEVAESASKEVYCRNRKIPGEEWDMTNQQPSRRGFLTLGSGAIAGLVAAPHALNAAEPDGQPHHSAQFAASQGEDMPKHEVRSGVAIAYEDQWFGPPWQDGEPIVLLHGVAESHVAWQQWIPLLSGQFRVLRPDLPGFGRSPLPAAYDCTTQTVARDIIRLLDALKVERFHLVGAKIGGSTSLQLAADYSDRVRSLAVFGTPAKGSPGGKADLTSFPDWIRKDGVRAWAAATMASRLGSEASPEMMKWWTDELMGKADPRACIGYSGAAGVMNLEPLLGKITAPTLVVTTEASPLQPVSAARAYQEMIPKSKLLVLPGNSYHIAAVRPQMCATQTLGFIASV